MRSVKIYGRSDDLIEVDGKAKGGTSRWPKSESAKCWRSAEGLSDKDVEDFFERFDVDDYNIAALREAMRILDGASP